MLSLKSIAKLQDPNSQVISTRSLAQKAPLQPPISLQRLNEIRYSSDDPSSSLLIGYKIPTVIPGADHTYVTSDNPSHAWGCWGRESGGIEICRGRGKYSVANCISQALPLMKPGTAGIIYGVTGVCHQTANRILYPARVTVTDAGGYWASVLAYGTYGTRFIVPFFPPIFSVGASAGASAEFFARLKACNAQLDVPALKSNVSIRPLNKNTQAQSKPKNNPEEIYIQKVADIYTEEMKTSSLLQKRNLACFDSKAMNEKNATLLGKELKLMMEFRLGGNQDPQITEPVLKKQSDFLKQKGKIDTEFNSADFSTEKYVKEVNDQFGDLLISLPDILGKEEYEKIFNLSPLDKGFVLVDPEIAVKALNQISKESIQPTA